MILNLDTGPASIVQSNNIDLLGFGAHEEDALVVHERKDEPRLFLHGDFSGFHMYAIVTHTKFKVNSSSVRLIDSKYFQAEVLFENEAGECLSRIITFSSPIYPAPLFSVSACKYGRDYDSFELGFLGGAKNQKFPCDIVFITRYSTDFNYDVPLKVKYIGMSAKNGRTAEQRLGEGHSKLQKIVTKLHSRDLFRSVSIVLYKPGKLDDNRIEFPDVVETLEASLIQYFKPTPYNIEHINFATNETKLTSKLKNLGARLVSIRFESPKSTVLYSDFSKEYKQSHQFFLALP
ncbi:hypothetical protein ACNUCD_004652 [Vibrio alginolyticus]